jgi:hypothetical protein
MVYPVFEENSIINRCKSDLEQFLAQYPLQETFTLELNSSNYTIFEDMKNAIQPLIQKLEITSDKNLINFNYVHDIINYDKNIQTKLWIVRTYLFYQILIFATKMMNNESLFSDVYNKNSQIVPTRIFRGDIKPELENYKMGIFGSLTPTSDIDIGVQYSGEIIGLIGLSYFVSIFEDLFLIFFNKNTLDFDIEMYADMMTLPNPHKNDTEHPDIFYLDTMNFNIDDFNEMLPYAGASILRNYVDAMIDLGNNNIEQNIGSFNYNMIYNYFPNFRELFNDDVQNLFSKNNWKNEASNMIKDYMTHDYNYGREKYYKLVNDAEITQQDAKVIINNVDKNHATFLNTRLILDIMKKIGKALVYRAESYTCAPTVMFVVRILQATKGDLSKYKTQTPVLCNFPLTNAICGIGRYGYIMSMLEQIGYLIRFDITYCEKKHYNAEKCNKKKIKYGERLDYALELYKHPIKTKRNAIGNLRSESLKTEFEKNNINDNTDFSDRQRHSFGGKRKIGKTKRRKSKRRKSKGRKNRRNKTRKQ